MEVIDSTREWYASYYEKKGHDRNDRLNPEVTFQNFATLKAVMQAIRETGLDRGLSSVLDVGCGSGESLLYLLEMGFRPHNLCGIDVLAERIAAAKQLLPTIDFRAGDASSLPWPDASFDLVMESTMFVQIGDENLSSRIAAEMTRVTRRYVLLIDWRYARAGYKAVSRARISQLFPTIEHLATFGGALIPPLGRVLSKHVPALYFLAHAFAPFLRGMQVTLLKK